MPREGVAARMRVKDFGGIVVVLVVFEDWGGRLLMAQWCGFSWSCSYSKLGGLGSVRRC